ncbi:G-D-S-L family lipolytic protein [Flavobacterium sp. ENC]|uniref:G-D-S-L family lipolytic protein n=1 Tax=Flavobacterium sp. ENC TaxID=2897330 RepID=UPI001E5022A4|nr:G-D-S-L family lipolytic protein [Flavobacterium sp. ENC]MCD0464554.1 G-D-S-L family lipolytic protein [Flavobacterium sp. ENC]
MKKNLKWLLLVSLTFMACNSDDEAVVIDSSDGAPLTAGTANFSKYVALGNSLTSGFSDGALFKRGQEGSYTNIMAQQFKLVGGGDFKIPYTNDNVGGLLFGGQVNPAFGPRLFFNGTAPVPVSGASTTEVFNAAVVAAGPYNNTGVPGAKSFHLLSPTYGAAAGLANGTANPYYVRFAPNGTTSVLAYAMSQTPTFFSLWIGNNDVLGYATSGGDGTNPITPATGAPGVGFDGTYNALVTTLTSAGAKGVVANIPYVTSIPFFKTVPYNPLTVSVLGSGNAAVGTATINALNAQLYGPLKDALAYLGVTNRIQLLSLTGGNPLLIKDESLTNLSAQLTAVFTPSLGAQTAAFYGAVFGQARQATAADLVLLTTQSAIGAAPTAANSGVGFAPPAPLNKFGITYPLQDKYVLIPTEIAELKVVTDAFNATISAAATAKGLAFVDANAIMDQIDKGGVVANNFTLASTFVTGGTFSLDGIHPSPRGYAFIANKFIEAINTKYGSNLKGVNVGNYQVLYPAVLP